MTRFVPFLVLLALAPLALPAGAGAPTIPDAISGSAHAWAVDVMTGCFFVQGGLYDTTYACTGCDIHLNLTASSLVVTQNGVPTTLPPGDYHITSFDGVLGIDDLGLHSFQVELDGTGVVSAWHL